MYSFSASQLYGMTAAPKASTQTSLSLALGTQNLQNYIYSIMNNVVMFHLNGREEILTLEIIELELNSYET